LDNYAIGQCRRRLRWIKVDTRGYWNFSWWSGSVVRIGPPKVEPHSDPAGSQKGRAFRRSRLTDAPAAPA